MLKTLISSGLVVAALLAAQTSVPASPRALSDAMCRAHAPAEATCAKTAAPRLLLIRDVRATMGGGNGNGGEGSGGNGGGNANRCWSTCFNSYNACMDKGPKDVCVSRMKTCLAICDTSN
jgi:hypothetical protein